MKVCSCLNVMFHGEICSEKLLLMGFGMSLQCDLYNKIVFCVFLRCV